MKLYDQLKKIVEGMTLQQAYDELTRLKVDGMMKSLIIRNLERKGVK